MKKQRIFTFKPAIILTANQAARHDGFYIARNKKTKYTEPVRWANGKCFTTTCELMLNQWEYIGPINIIESRILNPVTE